MRDGLYRSWFKGPFAQGSSAIILLDGKAASSDPGHSYIGSFTDVDGHLHAEVQAKRHTGLRFPGAVADLDEFTIICDGPSTQESATLKGFIPEVPGVALEIRLSWVDEV
ncbi:hypothetical protein FHS83_002725 [Rhizomicrobium palustre]|uniref:T3SS negative regulator,GrlR n=1 Tax=Rhizomicrobium palustre TaxID=189966 RepID=A0A846N2Q7_9PROT|nr:hypothetical protein [Rhizomicrobium palustre]NIK89407.1 hypothetical protein [Rhizomicrobium palustre]